MNVVRLQLQQFLTLALLLRVYANTRCYTCVNARSNEECNRNGEIKVCSPSEQSCQNEVRLSYPNGFGYLITKRCKQTLACANLQNQNRKPAWTPTQCNMEFKKNSVCQCCCTGDLCNMEELPCADVKKCPYREDPENGRVSCSNFNFLGSQCDYHCKNGYAVGGAKAIECVQKGFHLEWNSNDPVCAEMTCRDTMQPPVHGIMSCSRNFAVGSICSFRCSHGYEMKGSRRTICNSNGEWTHQPPQCNRIQCNDARNAPQFGSVQCSSANEYNSICEFACDRGHRLQGEVISVCQINGQWSSQPPICERVTCDTLPEDFQNGARLCTDGNFFTSICTYSCDQGYNLRGSISTTCLEDGKWSRNEPTCNIVHCASGPRIPDNGDILCSNRDAFASTCEFICKDGYVRIGSRSTTCQNDGQWSKTTPECRKIACNESHRFVENGEVKCTNGSEYASECRFACADGFYIIGREIITCEANLQWSDSAPVCEAHVCDKELEVSPNVRLECSDGSNLFSRCQYICGDGGDKWESIGETVSVCQRNETNGILDWSISQPPCCATYFLGFYCGKRNKRSDLEFHSVFGIDSQQYWESLKMRDGTCLSTCPYSYSGRCPPFAKVDLFIVLDSSSSVGQENWNKTLHFVVEILDDFAISPDNLQIGLIRYNKIVDEESEIIIGQYSTKEATINAILNMPYNGQGTNTGNAISYVVTQMMTQSGNRPDVEDMVLLITDGRSRDDLQEPSTKLRETGAKVVALGISNRPGSLTKEDLIDITDNTENTIVSTTGFHGISTDLIQAFITQICSNPCEQEKQ